jgi:hypothetical protein
MDLVAGVGGPKDSCGCLIEEAGDVLPKCFANAPNEVNSMKGIRLKVLLVGICTTIVGISTYNLLSPTVYAGPGTTAPEKPVAKNGPSGAELYAIYCNRCHPERYATEFTAGQWQTIMIHMRVRANIPAEQAREILKYLQQDSGR